MPAGRNGKEGELGESRNQAESEHNARHNPKRLAASQELITQIGTQG